jgi:hypothetical protein
MKSRGAKAIFAMHLCFAILVLGLVAINLVAAEAFFTQGRMSLVSVTQIPPSRP